MCRVMHVILDLIAQLRDYRILVAKALLPCFVWGAVGGAAADDSAVLRIGEIAQAFDDQQGKCGVDAAFVFCRLCGRDVAYEQLASTIPYSKTVGTSLGEFCQGLQRFGFSVRAVRTSPAELASKGVFPVVLLLQDGDEVGHYLVVHSIRDGVFVVVEAEQDKPIEMDQSMILAKWRGVAVVPSSAGSFSLKVLTLIVFAVASFFWLRVAKPLENRSVVGCLTIGLSVALLVIGVWWFSGFRLLGRETGPPQLSECLTVFPRLRPPVTAPLPMSSYPLPGLGSEQEDARLRSVCHSVIPLWRYRRFSDVLHALRVFGQQARFENVPRHPHVGEDANLLNGSDLFRFLLEPQSYQDAAGAPIPPYCFGFGEIVERQWDSPFLPAHRDDILAVLAELQVPLQTQVAYDGKAFTVGDLLCSSVAMFDPTQELEFTAVAYSVYLGRVGTWQNRFGDEFDFNDLARGLLRRSQHQTACLGTHVPYALACILQADAQCHVLSAGLRDEVREYLADLSRKVEVHQDDSGYYRPWHTDWAATNPVEQYHQAMLFTGHTLEWMALVDVPLRCSRESLRRAYRWGLWAIETQDASRFHLGFLYAPNSHLVRGLCSIRGVHPVEAVAGSWHPPQEKEP